MNDIDIKLYNSMIPKEYYRVPWELFETDCRYYTVLSKRASGKTTGVLLWCLMEYIRNGKTFTYVRTSENEIKASIVQDLFNVILNNNYISVITDGDYNNVFYHWRKLYLCKTDENGEIIEKQNKAFCTFLATSNHSKYKSSLNLPDCGYILFDEFISTDTKNIDFFKFFDLHSTITRKRDNVITFFLANNIDVNSVWFRKLCIEDVSRMKQGQKKMFVTTQGTKNYVEILGNNNLFNQITNKINRLYYGFNSSELNSITGTGEWSYNYYPYFDSEYILDEITDTIYLKYYSYIFAMDFMYNEKYEDCLFIHEVDYIPENAYIVLIAKEQNIEKCNEYKGLLDKQLTNTIQLLNYQGRLFTDTPFTWKIFNDYCKDYGIRI